MTKNIVYDKNGIPKISYRTEKGTVRIKELNNKRLYNKQEVIKYYNFFKVETLKFWYFKFLMVYPQLTINLHHDKNGNILP